MIPRPAFWDEDGAAARALAPLALLWTAATRLRQAGGRTAGAGVPVICVGDACAGGSGKTPLAMALLRWLAARGRRPHALSRGYGGRLRGPLKVDPERHGAGDVGDEALLLARCAPVWIGGDRAASARRAVADDADILVMDDGLQNPSLRKDLCVLAVDGGHGFGNGRALPAGPLREPLADALAKCRAAVVIGDDRHGLGARLAGGGLEVIEADLRLLGEAGALRGARIFAFAGIARPQKFFAALEAAGAVVVASRSFADHRPFDPRAIAAMAAEARRLDAQLATTEKDWVRLGEAQRALARPLAAELRFRDPAALDRLLAPFAGGWPALPPAAGP